MQDIKFRLIKEDRIVGYERWNSKVGKWCYDTKVDGLFEMEFIPHIDKESFIGLCDMNDTEVCVGDEIEDRFSNGKVYYRGVVLWGRSEAYSTGSSQGDFCSSSNQIDDNYGFLLKVGEPLNKTYLLRPVGDGNKICEEDLGEGGKFIIGHIHKTEKEK